MSKIITESIAQLSLSNPGIALGSGETSITMADRSFQLESLVFPHLILAYLCRPNLTGKHQLCIIDTNILVYANVIETPFHQQALATVNAVDQAGRTIWIS